MGPEKNLSVGRGLGDGGPDCFYHQLISQMGVLISLEKLFVLRDPIDF